MATRKLTLTIELPEEEAGLIDLITRVAEARGIDLNSYAIAAMREVVTADTEADAGLIADLIAADREADEDATVGRLLTLEQAAERGRAALAARRAERDRPRAA